MNESDNGRKIAAITLIGLGALFLLGQVFNFSFFGALWPLIVVLPGLAFLYGAWRGDKNAAGMAVPGAIITGLGGILFYQNITNHWESWAYAWTLFPVFLGLGLTFAGRRNGDQNAYRTGQGFVRWGSIAFLIGASFFELLIFNRGGVFGTLALPLLLIGLGVLLLFRRGEPSAFEKVKRDPTVLVGPRNTNARSNGQSPSASDELRRQIDAALSEDEPGDDKPKNS